MKPSLDSFLSAFLFWLFTAISKTFLLDATVAANCEELRSTAIAVALATLMRYWLLVWDLLLTLLIDMPLKSE